MAKRGLGKGLGALIDVSESVPAAEAGGVQEIDVNQIDVYKEQPRKIFDEEAYQKLLHIRSKGNSELERTLIDAGFFPAYRCGGTPEE